MGDEASRSDKGWEKLEDSSPISYCSGLFIIYVFASLISSSISCSETKEATTVSDRWNRENVQGHPICFMVGRLYKSKEEIPTSANASPLLATDSSHEWKGVLFTDGHVWTEA